MEIPERKANVNDHSVQPPRSTNFASKAKDGFVEPDKLEPIAIIGLSLKFPQNITSLDSLWETVAEKKCAMTEFPKSRLNLDAFYDPDTQKINGFPLRGAHFVEGDIAAFDAPFFSISPAEAAEMDPLQRGLLESSYRAFENAGIPLENVAGSNTAVYIGSFSDDYKALFHKDPEFAAQYSGSGVAPNMLANRISWSFDLRGTSLNLDTACSSSLVALHLACKGLIANDCNMALVGGGSLIFNPDMIRALNNQHFLSPSSRCFSFDHRADGYARGEGFGVLVLKRLHDAIRDNDNIRAVIRGTGSNQDGKTPGITQPSRLAQEQMMTETYEHAGLSPNRTRYVEAHGTGTPVGDPIEASAIGAVFGKYRSTSDPLYCGSIKANIGHLEGASGIAGLMKSILILERGLIPPNAGFERVNPNIKADSLNLKFPMEITPWPAKGLRRVSVNSFGFGGTNAHVILDDAYHYLQEHGLKGRHNTTFNEGESLHNGFHNHKGFGNSKQNDESDKALKYNEAILGNGDRNSFYEVHSDDYGVSSDNSDCSEGALNVAVSKQKPSSAGSLKIFVFSASDDGGLKRLSESYSHHLSGVVLDPEVNEEEYLKNLAYTLSNRRSSLIWKSFATMSSLSKVPKEGLKISKAVRVKSNPKLAFCFTGQGAQWFAMGRELSDYPIFMESLKEMDCYLKTLGCSWSLITELNLDEPSSNVNSPALSQPLCTAIQVSMVDLLRSFEIFPHHVLGHSSGEIAAAYCTGALDRRSAIKVSYYRGILTSRFAQEYPVGLGMLAVGLPENEVHQYLTTTIRMFPNPQLSIGCINSPKSVTITGHEDQIMALKELLDEDHIFARKLAVKVAYHSPILKKIVPEYIAVLGNLSNNDNPEIVHMTSSVTGEATSFKELRLASYWARNLTSPVNFAQGMTRLCNLQEIDSIIEIGPHSALQAPIKESIRTMKREDLVDYTSALARSVPATESLLNALGRLYCRGHSMNLSTINFPYDSATPGLLHNLPEYSFDHSRTYWRESRISRDYRLRQQPFNPFLGFPVPDWNPLHAIWRRKIRLSESSWLKDHKILGVVLFPAAAMLVMAIEAAKQMAQTRTELHISGFSFKDVRFLNSLSLDSSFDGVEVEFHLRPLRQSSDKDNAWEEFHLYAYENEVWSEKCRGRICVDFKEEGNEVDQGFEFSEERRLCQELFLDRRAVCDTQVDPLKTYGAYDSNGLGFGPAFQTVQNGSFSQRGEAVAEVSLHKWWSEGGEQYQRPYTIHPTALDGLLQLPFLTLSKGGTENIPSFVPTGIQKLWISNSGLLSNRKVEIIKASIKSSFRGMREAESNAFAIDSPETQLLISMEGYEMVALNNAGIGPEELSTQRTQCFNIDRRPDVGFLDQKRFETYSESILPSLAPPIEAHRARELVMNLSLLISVDEMVKIDETTLKAHHQKYLQWMRYSISKLGPEILHELREKLQDANTVDGLFNDLKNGSSTDKFVAEIGRNISNILLGKADALDLFFSGDLVKNHYVEVNEVSNINAFLLYLDALVHKNPRVKVLEIGAGTGGMTRHVLKTLTEYGEHESHVPRFEHYTYTDISSSFFKNGQELFRGFKDRVTFKTLDIERCPLRQGFDGETYDLIFADNVIHATKDLDASIKNARKLLKPGGKLVLTELMEPEGLFNNFAFGLLPGWWRAVDGYRGLSAAVTQDVWHEIFLKNGFSGIDLHVPDHVNRECHEHSILVTTAVDTTPKKASRKVVIIVDRKSAAQIDIAQRLHTGFLELGSPTVDIFSIEEASSISDAGAHFCIVLLEFDGAVLQEMDSEKFVVARNLIAAAEELIWVTRHGIQAGTLGDHTMINGLARAIRQEKSKMKFVTLAFECEERDGSHFSQSILQVFDQTTTLATDGYEPEYTERDGRLCIDRFVEAEYLNRDIVPRMQKHERETKNFGCGIPLKLSISSPGLLDTLEFIEDKESNSVLEADEIEIKIYASGVNFRDCLTALGRMPGSTFGFECAGTVHRIGEHCKEFVVGERVCANVAGTYQTFGRCLSSQAMPLPDHVSFPEGAALPVTFTTAYYALCHVARIRKGESILIHSAAGGTGQAAIQIAKLFDAEIYVTVGSEKKSRLLQDLYGIPKDHIFYSRNGSFAQGIKRMTQEHSGVDIVLNSLSGDALVKTWECVAPYGRFLEIGKKDILENGSLPMFQFAKNVSFHAIDLKDLGQYKPGLSHEIKQGVVSLLFDRKISPAQPLHIYGIEEVEKAFRYLQGGKNTGKTVIEMRPEAEILTVLERKPAWFFENSATYLISGGLGGIGRSIARWMAQRGVKHLILSSRFGPRTEAAHTLLRELQDLGVEVEILVADIADGPLLKGKLSELSRRMPPIKGCIQSSMVLADCPFESMSYSQWRAAIEPKVQGTFNLHTILPKGMDLFLMLSSIGGAIGSTTQANYAAGCSYQDTLAHHRVSVGEKATTFNLGFMLDDGVLTENSKMMTILKRTGYLVGITQQELYALLEHHCNPSQGLSTPLKTQVVIGIDVPASLKAKSIRPPVFMRRPPFRHFYNMRSALPSRGDDDKSNKESNELSISKVIASVKSLEEAAGKISHSLMAKLSRALAIPAENLDSSKAMHTYGVDSLVAVELRNWFVQTLDADVAIFELLGNATFQDIGVLVAGKSRLVLEVLNNSQKGEDDKAA